MLNLVTGGTSWVRESIGKVEIFMKSEHSACVSGGHFASKLRYVVSIKYTLDFEEFA